MLTKKDQLSLCDVFHEMIAHKDIAAVIVEWAYVPPARTKENAFAREMYKNLISSIYRGLEGYAHKPTLKIGRTMQGECIISLER